MSDTPSKFEQLRMEAIDVATDRMVAQLCKQGVSEPRARAFVDQRIELLTDDDLRVHAKAIVDGAQVLSRGTSLEHLEHFARQMHLRFAHVLGGEPVPFGDDPGPVNEAENEHAARVRAATAAAAEASRENYRRSLQPRPPSAQRVNALRVDPASAF